MVFLHKNTLGFLENHYFWSIILVIVNVYRDHLMQSGYGGNNMIGISNIS